MAVDAVARQGVGGVQDPFDGGNAVAVLAGTDIAAGEFQIIKDRRGFRPLRNRWLLRKKWLWPNAAWAITNACMVAVFSSIRYEMQGFELITTS